VRPNMQGEERVNESTTHACQVIRFLGHNRCVIRLLETGAVIPITLNHPLDSTKAALSSPFRAVNGSVQMGVFEGEGFSECKLEVEWNTLCFPLPQRYKRRKTDNPSFPHYDYTRS
jgi:hypothetical protein